MNLGKTIRKNTRHHKALQLLAVAEHVDGHHLHAIIDPEQSDSFARFRRDVLEELFERELAERMTATAWRITPAGRRVLAAFEGRFEVGTPANDEHGESLWETGHHCRPIDLANERDRGLLTTSKKRPTSEADLHPCTTRPGSEDFRQHPSRRGDRLYYRDGRVTDLDGNLISGAAA